MDDKPDSLPVVAWLADREAFEDRMYATGWRSIADGQHEGCEAFRLELVEAFSELTTTVECLDMANDLLAQCKAERATLQAELAAMRSQKPVAVVNEGPYSDSGSDGYHYEISERLPIGTKLYAAPLPAPSQVAAEVVRPAVSPSFPDDNRYTYCTTQATECAGCGVRKHTPLRVDWMGGYACLTCIDNKLDELNSEDDAEVVQVPVIERLIANLEILNKRPRPLCRDCADENGVCSSGLDCDMEALLAAARALLPTSQGEA